MLCLSGSTRLTKDLFDKVQEVMKWRSKPTPIRLKSYIYRGLFDCAECGCVITMETQKGHNYLRCTKRVKKDCSQPYLREESATKQIATILTRASLPDEVADWMIERLDAEREEGATLMRDAKKNVEKRIEKIDQQLDRLTTAYLDAGAFSAAEFRKRKEEGLNRKRKLLDDLAALDRDENKRFEPLKRFVSGSKQMKYVAERREPTELRAKLAEVGSNLMVRDRRRHWLPRGAWQLVIDQGSMAHVNAAAKIPAAASGGKSHLYPKQCPLWDSNPHDGLIHQRILSPVRLPIPSRGLGGKRPRARIFRQGHFRVKLSANNMSANCA